MPTGYTAAVKDGISFEQFVWTCARNFGALVMMRDEPMSATVPEKFEESRYYTTALAAAQDRLATLRAMSPAAAAENARAAYKVAMAAHLKREAEKDDLRARYSVMLIKAQEWVPPSAEHQGLKDFMVSQLRESIAWDCEPSAAPAPVTSATEWLAAQITEAERAVQYHTNAKAEEAERTASRNRWISDLRASVPQPNA